MLGVSERRACRIIGQPRSTQRRVRQTADDEAALTAEIVVLATQYGRYGYRRITALLRDAGWVVNRKRVERIWRREGLKVPQKQPKRGRLWLSDGSCIRLRAEHSNHVWAYDFVHERTHDGRALRMLTVVDEYTRDCLAIREKHEPDAWATFDTKSLLGGALLGQRKYAEAEPFLRDGFLGLKQREAKILPIDKKRLAEAAERLADLYDATGRPDQAKALRAGP